MKRWRRMLSVCIAAAIVLGALGAGVLTFAEEVLGDEMVLDGGFEAAEVGTKLSSSDKATEIPFVYNATEAVVSDTLAHSGHHALKLTRDASKELNVNLSLNYRLPLTKGKTYRFSVWVRFAPEFGENTGNFYIRMVDVGEDFTWNDRGVTKRLTGSDDFVKLEAICTPSVDYEKARINIGVETTASKEAVVYLDDLSCVEIIDSGEEPGEEVEPIEGNMVENPSFELKTLPSNLAQTNVVATRTTEEAHNGKYSCKVEQSKTFGALNYSRFNLEPGKSYYFSAWLRFGQADTVATRFNIRLFWDGSDANATSGLISSPIVTGKDGWVFLESILTVPSDAKKISPRFNIYAESYKSQPVTFYVDDVVLKEAVDMKVANAAWNLIDELNGMPICPLDTEVNLTFSGLFKDGALPSDAIRLNGAPVDASQVTVTKDSTNPKKVMIRLRGLECSKRYILSLTEGGWRDEFNRPITIQPLIFKTVARVAVGSKKLYINNAEVTDGTLQNGTVRAEVSGLRNMSGKTENLTAVLALFRDGEMVAINSDTVTVLPNADGTGKAETDLKVDMDGNGRYELKLFVWDDLRSGISFSPETVLQR